VNEPETNSSTQSDPNEIFTYNSETFHRPRLRKGDELLNQSTNCLIGNLFHVTKLEQVT